MRLPELPYAISRKKSEVVKFSGVNFSDNYAEGALWDCENISSRRYPHLTTRRERERQTAYSAATAMTAWGELVVVQNGRLLFGGEDVGEISDGEKQFAVVNTKLVIWPDRVYLDLDSKEIKPLAAQASGAGATFTDHTIEVSWADADFTQSFAVGDAVFITGCTVQEQNNLAGAVILKEVEAKKLTFDGTPFTAAAETGTVKIERRIPEMDFICESENRLWGCSNSERSIFASALADPTNFYDYSGESTDSYALAVGSEGAFTGCCKLSSSVLFWKNNVLHKILGGYPAEYELYTYTIEGVLGGCHKSMQVINETLLYLSAHGVFAYSGGTNSFLSAPLGDKNYTDAVAGNDGSSYYLSCKEGERRHLFVYDVKSGIWLREDDTQAVDFARIGKDLYMLTKAGEIYCMDSGEESGELEWRAQFAPFYETVEGRKRYSRLLLRLELPQGSFVTVQVRLDGGPWRECCRVVGTKEDVQPVVIVPNRCDKFEVRLSGRGQCTVLNMLRKFSVGGER